MLLKIKFISANLYKRVKEICLDSDMTDSSQVSPHPNPMHSKTISSTVLGPDFYTYKINVHYVY